mmetsp:Transcript_11836/g.33722  ORF Transcript_11836/g.33722 Transcript_11836/m.33722 type:complete len:218 (-) Transcript_11836:542-1195(-)
MGSKPCEACARRSARSSSNNSNATTWPHVAATCAADCPFSTKKSAIFRASTHAMSARLLSKSRMARVLPMYVASKRGQAPWTCRSGSGKRIIFRKDSAGRGSVCHMSSSQKPGRCVDKPSSNPGDRDINRMYERMSPHSRKERSRKVTSSDTGPNKRSRSAATAKLPRPTGSDMNSWPPTSTSLCPPATRSTVAPMLEVITRARRSKRHQPRVFHDP